MASAEKEKSSKRAPAATQSSIIKISKQYPEKLLTNSQYSKCGGVRISQLTSRLRLPNMCISRRRGAAVPVWLAKRESRDADSRWISRNSGEKRREGGTLLDRTRRPVVRSSSSSTEPGRWCDIFSSSFARERFLGKVELFRRYRSILFVYLEELPFFAFFFPSFALLLEGGRDGNKGEISPKAVL